MSEASILSSTEFITYIMLVMKSRLYSSIRSTTNRFKRRLHWRFPNTKWFQDPATVKFIRRRDAEENEATRLDSDEQVGALALWGTELYGPAEIEKLYVSLEKLGWEDADGHIRETGPGDWIAQQRMYGSSGNLNLGVIRRPGDRGLFGQNRIASIPMEVDYMFGHIHQVSPSLTAITLCFVLKNERTLDLHNILETSYRSRNERGRLRRGYRMIGPYHAKEREIRALRDRSQEMVARWFRINLPGFFSSRDAAARLPTAQLITTRKAQLLSSPRQTYALPRWASLVGRLGPREVWKREGSEAISLVWDESDRLGQFQGLVHVRAELLTKIDRGIYADQESASLTEIASQHVEGVLLYLSVLAGITEMQRGLRLARDGLSVASKSSRETLRTIQKIKNHFVGTNGLPTILSELVAQSKTDHHLRWTCEEFKADPWLEGQEPISLIETLGKRMNLVAGRAVANEHETRAHFEQMSSILNTQETIRTQRRMEVVTVVATVLTAASLFVALMSIKSFELLINSMFTWRFSG